MFQRSKNIFVVMMRGTNYLALKPKYHSKPPDLNTSINDVRNLDKKNKYDWIFISTEDYIIKERYIKEIKNKIKYLNHKVKIIYDYNHHKDLSENPLIKGNLDFTKTYLLNVIILSKCIDFIAARCSLAAGVFIITKGFRNSFVYNLGLF